MFIAKEVSITAVMFNGVVLNTIVMSAHNVIFGAGISEFREYSGISGYCNI